MEAKITNPFEAIDIRLAKIEDLLNKIAGQTPVASRLSEPSPAEYLSRREVADILDVCLTTVDHLSNAGILHKYRSGRVVRFLRAEVLTAISGGTSRNSHFPKQNAQKP